MSIPLTVAARRAYDALKERPGATLRVSDARDAATLAAISARLGELIGDYRLGVHRAPSGAPYIFWSEVSARIAEGALDDLLGGL